jgi:integrase/recombinase XerD
VLVPLPRLVMEGALENLLRDYRGYLTRERGLVEHTIRGHERVARLFLGELHAREERLVLERLTAADVSGFLARECPKRSVSGAMDLVFGLRVLLRYLHVTGAIGVPLVWAVPSVADVRDRSLPRGLEPAVVGQMPASCDRRTLLGQRDHAILVLLARLGLRAGEVAAVTLDDIDWRRGELVIHGKGARHDVLPVPIDVGETIASYLQQRGRFAGSRAVFLREHAPAGALSAGGVLGVVARACVRAGVPRVGAHRLRHTAATEMLRAGASLREIGQVLRHHRVQTTAIYAKVDRGSLRERIRSGSLQTTRARPPTSHRTRGEADRPAQVANRPPARSQPAQAHGRFATRPTSAFCLPSTAAQDGRCAVACTRGRWPQCPTRRSRR